MTSLGIDYGTKKVGFALSDTTDTIATPHTVLSNDEQLVQRVVQRCREEDVSRVVVGASTDLRGRDNPVMSGIRSFTNALKAQLEVPVILEPEFFTTAQAARIRENREQIDASAAALILQSYLDRAKYS